MLDQVDRAFAVDFKILKDFVALVKQECVMDKIYFSFFDIPDLIVRNHYSKKDYEKIIKVL